jgi:hypothetical protein
MHVLYRMRFSVESVIYCGVHALDVFPVPGRGKYVELIQSRAPDRHEPRTCSAYIRVRCNLTTGVFGSGRAGMSTY